MFNASTAAVLSHSHSHPAQIEGANFLNLLIVDDDRAIREACREVAQIPRIQHAGGGVRRTGLPLA